jgi:two-component sensor histidine kinase
MSAKVMETDGEKCILSVTRDITDRIEMEGRLRKTIQDKEVLLKELQHRVKNSLNIIIGLLSLGLRKIKDERSRQVLLNAQNRIRSMAMIYERLNSSAEFDTIELGPYVDNLSRTLFETYAANTKKIRLSTSLANVKLDVKRSISVGLILNELLTNALKYAFPVGSGEIRIDIEESEETVRLVVQDDGVGLPQGFDQENGDSIGLKLVGLLSEQVGGEMRIEGGQGVCVRVAFRK